MGYYDAISKKKAQAHMNEWNVVNYIMCPVVTKKLWHVFGDKSLVYPYQNPHRLINQLVELFSNPDDWVLDLFSWNMWHLSFNLFHLSSSSLYPLFSWLHKYHAPMFFLPSSWSSPQPKYIIVMVGDFHETCLLFNKVLPSCCQPSHV